MTKFIINSDEHPELYLVTFNTGLVGISHKFVQPGLNVLTMPVIADKPYIELDAVSVGYETVSVYTRGYAVISQVKDCLRLVFEENINDYDCNILYKNEGFRFKSISTSYYSSYSIPEISWSRYISLFFSTYKGVRNGYLEPVLGFDVPRFLP